MFGSLVSDSQFQIHDQMMFSFVTHAKLTVLTDAVWQSLYNVILAPIFFKTAIKFSPALSERKSKALQTRMV